MSRESAAQECRRFVRRHVVRRKLTHVRQDIVFREGLREFKRDVAVLSGNIGKQVIDVADANDIEHVPAIVLRHGDERRR